MYTVFIARVEVVGERITNIALMHKPNLLHIPLIATSNKSSRFKSREIVDMRQRKSKDKIIPDRRY